MKEGKMSKAYRFVDEGYARDLITEGVESGHMDFYTVDFIIEDEAYADRLYSASYGRHNDGRTTRVAFHERNVARGGVMYNFFEFPDGVDIDFAAIERYTRERGDAAFAADPPFDEREKQRLKRKSSKRDDVS
jgi:hypothetical protein